ncbi:hypothetical protein LUZ60_009190 [Juncus effusus]|nr:hypothetical protein LUZ60_009190 [Juncus effusus]
MQFEVQSLNSSKKDNGPSIQLISTNKPQGINELIAEATNVIKLGLHPIENQGERSQVFMLKNEANELVAVLKMMDCATTAAREVAAYVLDHNGFSGVTPSAVVKISHPDLNKTKVVSALLQRFIPHCCDGRAMGPSRFLVGPVHRIGILDIRVLNIDRHMGNILVKKKTNASDTITDEVYDLMPIDHELCLPEELEDPYFEWQSWRQASVPFSDYEKEYVASLDPFKDVDLLRSELPQIKEAAIRILILCMTFLKKAVSAGLCLSNIGDMMTAEFDKPSMLETLCRRAAGLICIEKSIEETDDSQYEDDNDDTQFEMDIVDIPFSNNKTKVIDGLAKAISLPNTEFNYAGKKVSFMMLSEEEWLNFLERFEEILPPAFEARTNMSLKRKLGTSCKF